jgi:hypothetical protein
MFGQILLLNSGLATLKKKGNSFFKYLKFQVVEKGETGLYVFLLITSLNKKIEVNV